MRKWKVEDTHLVYLNLFNCRATKVRQGVLSIAGFVSRIYTHMETQFGQDIDKQKTHKERS